MRACSIAHNTGDRLSVAHNRLLLRAHNARSAIMRLRKANLTMLSGGSLKGAETRFIIPESCCKSSTTRFTSKRTVSKQASERT